MFIKFSSSIGALLLLVIVTLVGSDPQAKIENRPIVEIPFDVSFRGVAFIPVRVNSGSPLHFLLDSGGAGNHLNNQLVEKLGLTAEDAIASTSGNSALPVGLIRKATVQVGNARSSAGAIIASPLAHLEPVFGRRVDGILGGDWMDQYVVQLDYVERKMRLYEPTSFRYNGRGASLPLTFVSGIPFVQMEVSLANGKTVKGSFLVDTAGGWMVVHIHHEVAAREGLKRGLTVLPETGLGIGGRTERVAARGDSLLIGPYRMTRPIVKFAEDVAGLRANPTSIGLVGMDVFRQFTVTFDYSRNVMYLEPNRLFGKLFVYDASGLRLRAQAPSFSRLSVVGVRESSPATDAGISPGDVLMKLDGKDAAALGLEVVRETLQVPNQSHKLTIVRDSKTLNVVLRTREMLQ